MANRLSVAVGDSETMRAGRFLTVTLPLDATTVTGNDDDADVAEAPPDAPATETASAASAAPASEDERAKHLKPPFREGFGI